MKSGMNILFLSRWYPYPVDNGSKIRVYNLISHLASRHRVDLISFEDCPIPEDSLKAMKSLCSEVKTTPYRPFCPNRPQAILGYISRDPRSVKDTYDQKMAALVEEAFSRRNYDVVIASQLDMAPYALLAKKSARILEEIELTTFYEVSKLPAPLLTTIRRKMMWKKWVHYVGSLLPSFDGATVVSDEERKLVSESAAARPPLRVIPNGVDVASLDGDFGQPVPGTLVFSGSLTYGPNYEAMAYFLSDIFPRVQERFPKATISITGKLDGVPVDRLPRRPGVKFTGFLEDVRPTISRSWANVVPMHTGGGTRLKVIESLGLGTPVVSTSKGVEGLNLVPGKDYLHGDDSGSFASALVKLLEDRSLRDRVSLHGRRTVAERFDWGKIGPCFCDFVETVASNYDRQINGKGSAK
jgi:polysaccharide biosynthesis protein PslH